MRQHGNRQAGLSASAPKKPPIASVVQHHAQQRAINMKTAVVLDKS
jgi:hypothetical protein